MDELDSITEQMIESGLFRCIDCEDIMAKAKIRCVDGGYIPAWLCTCKDEAFGDDPHVVIDLKEERPSC